MTYYTHRDIAILTAGIESIVLTHTGVTPVDSIFLTYVFMYYGSKAGAYFPDLDQPRPEKESCINKITSWFINITGGKHRSWQTHSLDICVGTFALFWFLASKFINDIILLHTLQMWLIAFWTGWGSHLFGDMLSRDGVRLFFWNKNIKLRLVPKSGKLPKTIPLVILVLGVIGSTICFTINQRSIAYGIIAIMLILLVITVKLCTITFKTGGDFNDVNNWEGIVYKLSHILTYISLGAIIFYHIIYQELHLTLTTFINQLK